MKKEFKYPCAVKTDSLTEDQGNALQEAFIKLGATLCDYYNNWAYYGVDNEGETQYYSYIDSFADEDEEVVLFTYDEIMSFVAELEQPEEAPVAKKQLEFPCAIAMSEITSQEVYDKVFNAFIEAGAVCHENYGLYKTEIIGYSYLGVATTGNTIHFHSPEDFGNNTQIYSLEDILGTVGQQEALSEPLGDVLADGPSVGIKESVSSPQPVTGASDEPQFKVVCNKTYTVIIKGQTFELTSDEFNELETAMEDF